MGMGSGILILEELNHALKRNAPIFCEILSYGTYGDAYHITKPMSDGEGGFRAMAKCIMDSNLIPSDIKFINCHATSTDVGDLSELNALKNLFGNKKYNDKNYFYDSIKNFEYEFNLQEDELDKENLKQLILNANKSQIGHLIGAAGSVESIFSILSMYENKIIDNINTNKPISDLFNFRYQDDIYNDPQFIKNKLQYCLKNSFAFGGINTSVLFKKYS